MIVIRSKFLQSVAIPPDHVHSDFELIYCIVPDLNHYNNVKKTQLDFLQLGTGTAATHL